MTPLLSIEDFWAIYEWYDNGNIYFHITLWCSECPTRESIDQADLIAWLDDKIVAWNPLGSHESATQPINDNQGQNSLSDLINRFQRHCNCSAPSCLRE